MHYIDTTDHEIKGLGFYLAEEEYVARHILKDEDCFFIWHVHPTVIFGRNQVVENEVNMDYCRQEGIHTHDPFRISVTQRNFLHLSGWLVDEGRVALHHDLCVSRYSKV